MGTRMWRIGIVVLLAAAGLACAQGEISAVDLANATLSGEWGAGGHSVGWEFTPPTDIHVTHLGLAMNGDNRLDNEHQVLIYGAGSEPLVVQVFAKYSGLTFGLDGYYYKELASPFLLPGDGNTTYMVVVYAAETTSDFQIANVTGACFHPGIGVGRTGLYGADISGPVKPTAATSAYQWLSPSFKFIPAVANQVPVIGSVTIEPAALNTASQVVVVYSDDDATGLTATVNWGDGAEPAEADSVTSGTVTDSHTYAATGVYEVTVTLTDNEGASVSSTAFAPVYDPTVGFVTGGGWVTATEKANFGFVCKYLKGATTPSGQLQFKDGNLNFHSTAYDWLVVLADGTAQFAGVGTINGEGSYYFVVDVSDEPDEFRIDILDYRYDSGSLPLGGGQIKIHRK